MIRHVIFFVFLFFSGSAFALTTSSSALRIENQGTLVLGAERASVEPEDHFHSVVFVYGTLDFYGEADDVVVLSGKVFFHKGSKVSKLVILSGEYSSEVGSNLNNSNIVFQAPSFWWRILTSLGGVWASLAKGAVFWIFIVFSTLMTWLSGLMAFAMFPKWRERIETKLVRNWARNSFAAILSLLLLPGIIIGLIITLVGIFLLPVLVLILLTLASFSYAGAGLWVGSWFITSKKSGVHPMGFLLGLVLLEVLWYSGIWGTSAFVLLLWFLAWGSVVRATFSR